MFIIEITLKNTPLSLSVQRKSSEDAEAAYQKVLTAIQAGGHEILQLTCDQQTEKKIGILSSEISAVQISVKSGSSSSSGKPPGFFAMVEESLTRG
jgi:hypothetical protein